MSLTSSTGLASFKAVYDYEPQPGQGEIELKVGDICMVQKPIHNPHDWLEGLNKRTEQFGIFPGTYVEIYQLDVPVSRQTRPKVPPRKDTQSKLAGDLLAPINGHILRTVTFVRPVWCCVCVEFIWGKSKKSLVCSGCSLVAHIGCHSLFQKYPCQRGLTSAVPIVEDEVFKAVELWTNVDVLEWMAAVKLHPYIHVFRDARLTGRGLENLTEDFLKANIGTELHVKIVKMCIEELLFTGSSDEGSSSALVLPRTRTAETQSHQLYEHTFTSFQMCDLCKKLLFGLFRQGYMCADCGIQCHRPCAISSIDHCTMKYCRGRRPSDAEVPSFVCNYNTPAIPAVMSQCVAAVERHGLEIANLYDAFVPYDQWHALRAALNQDAEVVNMADSYWSHPVCAASVLKSFLLELPEPLIPCEMYGRFIGAVAEPEPASGGKHPVLQLLSQLSETKVAHLEFVLFHLARVCQYKDKNMMSLDALGRIFGFLFLRPNEKDARVFVDDLARQSEVVRILICAYMQMPQSRPAPGHSQAWSANLVQQELEKYDWFWGDINKKEVSELLQGSPDGSFLVRNSATSGEWALTVRKDGVDRHIRIMQRNGFYGFREDDLKYHSIEDLVNFFRQNSLRSYNQKLDVKLLSPISKPDRSDPQTDVADHLELKATYEELDKNLKYIKGLEAQTAEKLQMLEEAKMLSDAQTEVVYFIEEQIQLALQQFSECALADRAILNSSLTTLNRLLHEEKARWKELDEDLGLAKHEHTLLNMQLTELKAEIPDLQREWNRLDKKMKVAFPELYSTAEEEEKEEELIYDVVPAHLKAEAMKEDSLEESSWFFRKVVPRAEIHKLLDNKPDGTFFVRPSERLPGTFVISLVHDSAIKHVPIEQGPNGFGFAEPHNIYPTILDLVNHYHNQSLRMHNATLDTTLMFPLRYIDSECIYE